MPFVENHTQLSVQFKHLACGDWETVLTIFWVTMSTLCHCSIYHKARNALDRSVDEQEVIISRSLTACHAQSSRRVLSTHHEHLADLLVVFESCLKIKNS